MEAEVMNMLMSGGANLAFAVFLYQQNKDLQRRADERELKQERKEEELRNRYDQVIRDLQTREETVRNELVNDVNNLDKRMSLLEQSITTLSTIISEIKASLIRVDNAT
jgi:tRNA C32,U32 (ribose-2'-O)-methylase TrmJ|tara:strand:- start:1454 stop:1780 length:327 start_codon:yes stop_codon:yes gene_type:complete